MRRKDREVLDRTEIFDMLNRCDTIRLAVQGEPYPYVCPSVRKCREMTRSSTFTVPGRG